MKQRPFKLSENWKILEESEDGLALRSGDGLMIIVSWGMGWDHVSVSRRNRCPDWEEMCRVKRTFFEPEECVIQYHPPKSHYKNYHPYCLHLWKPQGVELPMPPSYMVAP